jgi:hypothetical protein
MKTPYLRGLSLALFLFLASVCGFSQAPPLPDGLNSDPRLTWHPTLQPTATVVIDALGVVTNWRSGKPVVVPTGGRLPMAVAMEQMQNNAGEWIGFFGRQGSVKVGSRVDKDETARQIGYQGISVVGLEADSFSSDGSVLAGFQLAQYVGVNRDIAFLHLTIDSWDNRPCTTAAHANPTYGHLYLEEIEVLSIGRDQQNQTAKGAGLTTWVGRFDGHVQLHAKGVRMVGGVTKGDGLAGTVEHGIYQNGPPGDSELVDCEFHGCAISAVYWVTRFLDRIDLGAGWSERFGYGTLLLENLTAIDCGRNGSFAVNVCGGLLHVVLRNYHYRVNCDDGANPPKWAGGAIQFYTDNKAYELVPPVNSGSVPIALGYSLETGTGLPMSDGVQDLVDNGTLPWDGYGAARSLEVIGGTFEVQNLQPPLIKLRDVALVSFTDGEGQAPKLSVSGLGSGRWVQFASSGQGSQCGPAQAPGKPAGKVPVQLGAGWNQQCRFYSRKPPSAWFGRVQIGTTYVTPADLDTWLWKP